MSDFGAKPQEDESSEAETSSAVKKQALENVNTKILENIAQDFSFTYKKKADLISDEIRQDLVYPELIQ